eukprot:6168812-Alexandrium_andersonii.AAC.1
MARKGSAEIREVATHLSVRDSSIGQDLPDMVQACQAGLAAGRGGGSTRRVLGIQLGEAAPCRFPNVEGVSRPPCRHTSPVRRDASAKGLLRVVGGGPGESWGEVAAIAVNGAPCLSKPETGALVLVRPSLRHHR